MRTSRGEKSTIWKRSSFRAGGGGRWCGGWRAEREWIVEKKGSGGGGGIWKKVSDRKRQNKTRESCQRKSACEPRLNLNHIKYCRRVEKQSNTTTRILRSVQMIFIFSEASKTDGALLIIFGFKKQHTHTQTHTHQLWLPQWEFYIKDLVLTHFKAFISFLMNLFPDDEHVWGPISSHLGLAYSPLAGYWRISSTCCLILRLIHPLVSLH